MQPPKSSICVICGIRPATTVEHVPPKGFFKGYSGELRTVPACTTCNNSSSGSANGVFIGEFAQSRKIVAAEKILPGQIFRVGLTRFRLEHEDAQAGKLMTAVQTI